MKISRRGKIALSLFGAHLVLSFIKSRIDKREDEEVVVERPETVDDLDKVRAPFEKKKLVISFIDDTLFAIFAIEAVLAMVERSLGIPMVLCLRTLHDFKEDKVLL